MNAPQIPLWRIEMYKEAIYRKALDKWGILAQILMFFEETAELQKAICKKERGKGTQIAIIEELADVEIMLEQMKFVYDRGGEFFREAKRRKLERLSNMVEEKP